MRMQIIHNTDKYRVDSYGNGVSYTFTRKDVMRDIFFQGDDAGYFSDEIEALEKLGWNYNRIFDHIWSDYSELSEPV